MKKLLIPILCALPFVGIALWFITGKNAGNLLTFGLILACPLSHMFLMGHGNAKKEHKH
ncbi:MAG: DUF2933 domain-containing protein [Candidatus Gottesmanbacteria bacterium]|nr:DUF2933 domain-containing protein [Candidatus Gottesmanbacteria bacterium]